MRKIDSSRKIFRRYFGCPLIFCPAANGYQVATIGQYGRDEWNWPHYLTITITWDKCPLARTPQENKLYMGLVFIFFNFTHLTAYSIIELCHSKNYLLLTVAGIERSSADKDNAANRQSSLTCIPLFSDRTITLSKKGISIFVYCQISILITHVILNGCAILWHLFATCSAFSNWHSPLYGVVYWTNLYDPCCHFRHTEDG